MSGPTFAIVVPSYNNASWVSNNLRSLAEQTYTNFHLYYIDDASTDDTKELAELFLEQPGLAGKYTLISNSVRAGALANIYNTVTGLEPHTVVVGLDGDDWLAHPKVLERVAEVYKDPNVWMSYGSFESDPPGYKFDKPTGMAPHRKERGNWLVPLRTYYAKLFQHIKKEDLQLDGSFFMTTSDIAYMFPMIEMAMNGHYRFIDELLYIYNIKNPINDFRINRPEQNEIRLLIESKEPYAPLERLFKII